jgi:hypothetical protein
MFLAFVLLCALAQEGSPAPADEPRLQVSALGWYAMPSGWLYITLGSQPGTATHMDLGSDADLDSRFVPALDGRFRFSESHAVGLQFASIAASGTRSADEAFIYHGQLFDAGRRVRAELDLTFLEMDYQYTFNPADRLRVTGHLGAEYWKFSGRVKTEDALPPLDTRRGFDSGFWMAGIDLSWRVDPLLEVRAFGAGGFERARQNFFKIEGDLLFKPLDQVALSLGYRLHALRFLQSTNRSNLKFDGPTLGLELSF